MRGMRIPVVTIAMSLSARTASKAATKPAVAVADWIPHADAGVLKVHDEVLGHLGRRGCGGVGGHAENPPAAGGMCKDGQGIQSGCGEGLGLEEVRGEDGGCLAVQEGGPGQSVAFGAGFDVVGFEDLPHGEGRHRDAQAGEFAMGPAVDPVRVLVGMRRMSTRMLRTVGGRPGCLGRDLRAWWRRSRVRCQRRMVSGETIR